MREVEVKFRVHDADALAAALTARGIELGPAVRQDDQAYAPVGWEYGKARGGVPFARLRTVKGRHTFTVKRPAENVLSCDEYESPVADRDQMHQAVLAMGFRPTVQIGKVRRSAVDLGRLGIWTYAGRCACSFRRAGLQPSCPAGVSPGAGTGLLQMIPALGGGR